MDGSQKDRKRPFSILLLYVCYPVAIRLPSFCDPIRFLSSHGFQLWSIGATLWPTSSVTPSHPQSVFRSLTRNLQPVSNLLSVTHNMIPVPHRILGNYLYFGIAKLIFSCRFSEYVSEHPELPILSHLSDLYSLWVVEVTSKYSNCTVCNIAGPESRLLW